MKAELVEEEFHHRKKKLERVDNAIRNATKTGGPQVYHYSYQHETDELRKRIEASLTLKTKQKKTRTRLTEPLSPITHLLHRCSQGRASALAYLRDEGGLDRLRALPPSQVWSSVRCYRDVVGSPVNYKVECMWRLAVIADEWVEGWGGEDVMWRVSHGMYGVLIELCHPSSNPWQYSALRAGVERLEERLEEWEMRRLLDGCNREVLFTPPNFDDGQAMFFFQS